MFSWEYVEVFSATVSEGVWKVSYKEKPFQEQ